MSIVDYPHIDVEKDGQAYIAGTGFKVRMLIEEHLAGPLETAELQRRHPQLSLAQIYSALAYYHDHKDQIDREIESLAHAEKELRPQLENPATTEKLRQAMRGRRELE